MEYIRYVVYLNEYRDGKRQYMRPGFARLERRGGIWSLSVMPEETGIKQPVPVYIAGENESGCLAYRVGEWDIQNPVHEKLEAGAGWFIWELDVVRGILIGTPEHYLAGTCHGVDGELSFDALKIWGQQEGETGRGQAAAAEVNNMEESRTAAGNVVMMEDESAAESIYSAEADVPAENEAAKPEETESEAAESKATESAERSVPEKGTVSEEQPASEERREQRNPFSGLQSMYPFEDDEMDWCYQIEPKDLGNFSTEEWHLASNSFLLQGYYNYRHLMFAHKKGKNYIGVPGQFHRREQYLASRFGFSQFKGTQRKRVTMGDFGYWMREIGGQFS